MRVSAVGVKAAPRIMRATAAKVMKAEQQAVALGGLEKAQVKRAESGVVRVEPVARLEKLLAGGEERVAANTVRLPRGRGQRPFGLDLNRVPTANRTEVRDIIAKRMPSVVVIRTKSGLGSGYAVDMTPFLPRYLQVPPGKTVILTNNHVVQTDKKSGLMRLVQIPESVGIELHDGRKTSGIVVATDPASDSAFVMIDTPRRPLPKIPIGDWRELRAGDPVLILGHPAGLQWSVARGVVSHPARKVPGNPYPVIQTDAAINPGNSGGPMLILDGSGRVVGTNSFKLVDPRIDNIGFAYHVEDQMRALVNDLLKRRGSAPMYREPPAVSDGKLVPVDRAA